MIKYVGSIILIGLVGVMMAAGSVCAEYCVDDPQPLVRGDVILEDQMVISDDTGVDTADNADDEPWVIAPSPITTNENVDSENLISSSTVLPVWEILGVLGGIGVVGIFGIVRLMKE